MDFKQLKKEYNIPWLTESGQIDYSKYPIDYLTKDSLSSDDEKFRNACNLLGSMVYANRLDAGIFLIGLIVYYKKINIKRLETIVEELKYFRNIECANFLFDELINTESNNTYKIYINSIIDILSQFPSEIVEERFIELSYDKRFSYKKRNKFSSIIDKFENKFSDFDFDI